MGDIVHSPTVYSKDTNTVFAGANDGMLHAFDGSTGSELFAYVPSVLLPKLQSLADPNYSHDYFVDGEIAVSAQSNTTRNYLVGTLGRGGKGLYSLDVSNPAKFQETNVQWEYFNSSDADLGYMLGRPVIAKMNNGAWAVIVGNGYNSTTEKAVLYIFELSTGNLIKKIDTGVDNDNGLSSPGVFDADDDGDIDYIYAGDLKGNLWKFDVSSASTSLWDSALSLGNVPTPLFVATDANGNRQPITAPISVAVNDQQSDPNYTKRFVFFGTGSYFQTGDPNDNQIQSWYGIIDEDMRITNRNNMTERKISQVSTFDGKPVRVFEQGTAGDMDGKNGWYLDFSIDPGERIVTKSNLYQFVKPALIASSIIPVIDPCVPGGRGYLNAINPFTGEGLLEGIFDINNSDSFSDDVLGSSYISSVDLGVGMPSEAVLVGDRLVVGGATGELADLKVNYGVTPIRGRIGWRELIPE